MHADVFLVAISSKIFYMKTKLFGRVLQRVFASIWMWLNFFKSDYEIKSTQSNTFILLLAIL